MEVVVSRFVIIFLNGREVTLPRLLSQHLSTVKVSEIVEVFNVYNVSYYIPGILLDVFFHG